jgi:integrase
MRGHIKQRDKGIWTVVIYLGKDPVTEKKKYKWYTVYGDKEDAEKFLTEKLRQMDTNTYADPGKLTVAEYLKRWVRDYCEISLSQNALARYRGIVNNHLIPALGKIPLGKLHAADVQQYYAEALKSGRKDNKKTVGKGLSAASVLYAHRVLHEALHHAVRWGVISFNVSDRVRPPKIAKKEARTLDKPAIDVLLSEARDTPMYIPICLAVHAGMRRGEIAALQWKNVDLKAGIIYVREAMELVRETNEHKIKAVKNEESRRIDITKQLTAILKEHKERQRKLRKATSGQINDFVCTYEDGRPLRLDYITNNFLRIAKSCHIDINFHGLRHTHATILAGMGIPVKAIAERLGNDPVVTLGTYSHVTPSIQREIVMKLEEYFR